MTASANNSDRATQPVEAERSQPSFPSRSSMGDETNKSLTGGAVASASPTANIGRRIRDYELLELLGQGGMGSVWKAKHTRLKRMVALKLLPPERMADAAAVARFTREMEAVGQLRHPHIIEALDAGEEAGTHYLVMEFVEGIELAALSKKVSPLPIADACELMRQTSLGLQHAFEHGLVHRDIKPSNLLLGLAEGQGLRAEGKTSDMSSVRPSPLSPQPSACQLKILDLGLALLQGDVATGSDLTSTGQVMGTLDYIAPEQLADTHAVDIRADLYSLGCTLYRLLTGEPPFSSATLNTAAKKIYAHSFTPPPSLLARRSDAPPELAALVNRLLAKKPEERFATPNEVAAALAPFCVGHNLPALLARSASALSASDPFASTVVPESRMAALGRPAVQVSQNQTAEGGHPTNAREPLTVEHVSNVLHIPRSRRMFVIAAAILAFVVLLGIVIKIKHKDGTVTEIKVPDDVTVEITKDDASRRMAAPGRPAVPNNPANTKSTAPGKEGQDRTAEGGHPTRGDADERADWPEWAKELREPPPLEEWLQGRKVLNVKQDGSAMFQTIQAALDKVQPGEVIRVLDKGPYRERLVGNRRAIENFGLVSDQSTVIELRDWGVNSGNKETPMGHDFGGLRNFRLHGFTFLSVTTEASTATPFHIFDSPGLCLEDCVFLAPISEPKDLDSHRQWCHIFFGDRMLPGHSSSVRRCVFELPLGFDGLESTATALMTNNLFIWRQAGNAALNVNLRRANHSVAITRNIFAEANANAVGHSIQLGCSQDPEGDDRLVVTHNTFMHSNERTVNVIDGSPGRDVVFRENLLPTKSFGAGFGGGAKPLAPPPREHWLVRNNWGGQTNQFAHWVPLTDPAHTGELPYLSLDPEHPNFLRLDPAKLPAGAKDIPGALPPGPPPPEGDWFTRLQSRLKEAQAASRAQYK